MNQSQRMAPVGSDKELSDLLDFSMVSCPPMPSSAPRLESTAKGGGVRASRHEAPSSQKLGPPNRHGDTHKRNGPTYHFRWGN